MQKIFTGLIVIALIAFIYFNYLTPKPLPYPIPDPIPEPKILLGKILGVTSDVILENYDFTIEKNSNNIKIIGDDCIFIIDQKDISGNINNIINSNVDKKNEYYYSMGCFINYIDKYIKELSSRLHNYNNPDTKFINIYITTNTQDIIKGNNKYYRSNILELIETYINLSDFENTLNSFISYTRNQIRLPSISHNIINNILAGSVRIFYRLFKYKLKNGDTNIIFPYALDAIVNIGSLLINKKISPFLDIIEYNGTDNYLNQNLKYLDLYKQSNISINDTPELGEKYNIDDVLRGILVDVYNNNKSDNFINRILYTEKKGFFRMSWNFAQIKNANEFTDDKFLPTDYESGTLLKITMLENFYIICSIGANKDLLDYFTNLNFNIRYTFDVFDKNSIYDPTPKSIIEDRLKLLNDIYPN